MNSIKDFFGDSPLTSHKFYYFWTTIVVFISLALLIRANNDLSGNIRNPQINLTSEIDEYRNYVLGISIFLTVLLLFINVSMVALSPDTSRWWIFAITLVLSLGAMGWSSQIVNKTPQYYGRESFVIKI
jgi:hypothetical protein